MLANQLKNSLDYMAGVWYGANLVASNFHTKRDGQIPIMFHEGEPQFFDTDTKKR